MANPLRFVAPQEGTEPSHRPALISAVAGIVFVGIGAALLVAGSSLPSIP
ncbi:MAG: hypothetical protein Q4G50_01245 [Corynebacterium sp.]|nr:hypothetical protein [Corynebacterium sp.]MDO5668606.1 hypothetical protein [Corynebacterium sp.]